MNRIHLATLTVALIGTTAAADSVSSAVRTETSTLARQYAGTVCRNDYESDVDRFSKPLSTAQIRNQRIRIYNDWKADLEEEKRDDGETYRIGYTNNRVWFWQKDRDSGKREFKVVTIGKNNKRELSCKL